jgi:uncharacterized membrane protein YheB (UPF0754 family)
VVLRVAGSSPVSHPENPAAEFPAGVFLYIQLIQMSYWIIIIPLLTAFTGWIVVRLLIKLLFRPLQPQKMFGFTWQGILPRHKQQMAEKIGQLTAAEFSSFSLENKINDPQNFENLKPLIETHVDDFLRNKLKEQMPMISMFIGDKTINTLKEIFIKEVESLFPQVMQQFAGNLRSKIDVAQIVSSKIAGISPEQIENQLYKSMTREIGKASLFGFLIGLLVGIVQFLLLFFLS